MESNEQRVLLETRAITKAYPRVLAVNRVSLSLKAGEVHGIVGQNGAGKTTLMKILAGHTTPDTGEIRLDGRPVAFKSPSAAIEQGIGMVQQHFALVPTMTVAENIALAEGRLRFSAKLGLLPLNFKKMEERVRNLAEQYRIAVPPASPVEELSVGLEQQVELLRTLYLNTRILILDEPTAVLTPREVRDLTQTLRNLTASGTGIFFVSHHLQEVLDFTDRISVMRNGQLIDTVKSAEASKNELARMMMGAMVHRPTPTTPPTPARAQARPPLEIRDLWVRAQKKAFAVQGVSLSIPTGEILGIAGLDGNGQVELADAIAGLRRVERGVVLLKAREVTHWPVKRLQDEGLAYIPPDRRLNAVAQGFDVAHNLILRTYDRPPNSRWGLLRYDTIRARADRLIQAFNIKVTNSFQTLNTLSGGNQQKVVLARELQERPEVLISCYATRGLDVAAVAALQEEMLKARGDGTAVLYISNEIDELLEISDRIAVMNAGKIAGIVKPAETNEEEIGLLMGQK